MPADYLAAYGSLMSHESRLRFSSISSETIAVRVSGWHRGWFTRSLTECQTYVGAQPAAGFLNATLIQVAEIDAGLRDREKDFRFTPVSVDAITPYSGNARNVVGRDDRIWICETLSPVTADIRHPVNQSYLDTCLLGCLETGLEDFAQDFLRTTAHLTDHWVDDRSDARYPRRAPLTPDQQTRIDELLNDAGLLLFRHR